jgi:TRAP-type uncharacterized transport system substrate-binding protein
MKLLLLYRRRWWLFYLPVLLCTALRPVVGGHAVEGAAAREAVIGAGSPQGGYSMLAQRYAEQLERIGVRAEIVYSDTQKGSLERLTRTGDATSIGFAHGIYANAQTKVQALAVVGQEPVWIFLHGRRAVVAGASQRPAHRRRAGLVIVLHRGQADAGARGRPACRRSV